MSPVKFVILLCWAAYAQGSYDQQDFRLLEDLVSILADINTETAFDNELLKIEVQRILEDNGFDPNDKLLSDGLLSGLWGVVTGGDTKWATLNLAKQISCYQGRSTNILVAVYYGYAKYNGYGCYCGPGVHDGNYVDETDKCCKLHDECYMRAQLKYDIKQGCDTYTRSYAVTCCENERTTRCTNTGPSDGRALCECDQEMAKCLAERKVMSSYNYIYKNDRLMCSSTNQNKGKIYSWLEILKSCKHASFKSKKKGPQTVRSEGRCPRRKRSWWWR